MNKVHFPFYGWIGLALILIFWILNWSLTGLRTHYGFFPLWLGYCLTVDALVYKRKNSSLIHRNLKAFIALFFISMPVWWVFEFLNTFAHNWYYDGKEYFSDLEYFLLASLNFSIVIPAVFGSAELISTFKFTQKIKPGPEIKPTDFTADLFLAIGVFMLLLIILLNEFFYYLIWLSVYFIVEPINVKKGFRNLLIYTKERNWVPVYNLWLGCLMCGFFWEMWNYYSYPKWIYDLPYLNSLHIFEMPLPGYLGYLPFSLELFAVYHLLTGLFKKNNLNNYIQIDSR